MAKTLQQIEAALAERYAGRTDTKNNMTYAAWEDITYAANRIFGALGWSREFVKTPYREGDGFACILRVTVYFIDEDGTQRSIAFEAPGYNELSSAASAVDTAFKGCYADALKKVLQALGDAFGLFIGAEAKAEKAAQKNGGSYQRATGGATISAPRSASTGSWSEKPALEDVGSKDEGHRGLSTAQINAVKRYGVSDAELEAMTRAEAKAILDNKGRPGAPTRNEATAARVGTPSDDEEDDGLF